MARSARSDSAKPRAASSRSSSPVAATRSGSSRLGRQVEAPDRNIRTCSLEELPPDDTDWAKVDRLTDEEIKAAVRADPDAVDTPPGFWADAELLVLPSKELISIRVDKDVLDWFRSLGRGYQTRMNMVLRSFMEHQQKR